jgi:hypothetical protein
VGVREVREVKEIKEVKETKESEEISNLSKFLKFPKLPTIPLPLPRRQTPRHHNFGHKFLYFRKIVLPLYEYLLLRIQKQKTI